MNLLQSLLFFSDSLWRIFWARMFSVSMLRVCFVSATGRWRTGGGRRPRPWWPLWGWWRQGGPGSWCPLSATVWQWLECVSVRTRCTVSTVHRTLYTAGMGHNCINNKVHPPSWSHATLGSLSQIFLKTMEKKWMWLKFNSWNLTQTLVERKTDYY